MRKVMLTLLEVLPTIDRYRLKIGKDKLVLVHNMKAYWRTDLQLHSLSTLALYESG